MAAFSSYFFTSQEGGNQEVFWEIDGLLFRVFRTSHPTVP